MQLKLVFHFNRQRGYKIRKLAEQHAKEAKKGVDTQATLDALVDRAYELLLEEQQTGMRKSA